MTSKRMPSRARGLLLAAVMLCILLLGAALPVRADGAYVYDMAGLLRESERQELESRAAEISQRLECGVYIAAVDDYTDYGSGSISTVAESIFQSNGFGLYNDHSGILLLLSIRERDYYVYTHGFATSSISGSAMTRLERSFLDDFRNNDWYNGFRDFLDSCDAALTGSLEEWEASQNQDQGFGFGFSIAVGLVIGCIVALIACSIMKAKMKSVAKARTAQFYAVPGSMDLYESSDVFTHITESRVKIESDSGRSGGGGRPSGGSGGHGGKF